MEFILIALGVMLLGGSAYLIANKDKSNTNQRSHAPRSVSLQPVTVISNVESEEQLLEGLDLSRFELIPQPISKKGLYIALVTGCFIGAVLCMTNALSAYYFSSSFWLFVAACILFGFGCYFMGWVRQADEWLLAEQKRITEINDERIRQKKQVIDHHLAAKEAAAEALLRSKQINNKIQQEKTIQIDTDIIHSNTNEARQYKIPVTAFTATRSEDFATQVQLENLKKAKKIETDAKKEQDENAAAIKQKERHYQITAIERTQYDKETEELLDKIGEYEEAIETLKLDASLEPTIRDARIRKYERKIQNKQEQLDGLRARLRQVDDGQKTRRINS